MECKGAWRRSGAGGGWGKYTENQSDHIKEDMDTKEKRYTNVSIILT